MKLNRELQRALLEELRDFYPRRSQSAYQLDGYTQVECINNLVYLEEQGLVESGVALGGSGTISQARITAKGIDFLEDDGGLGAILGTVTIKLHADTLRQLIEAKVKASDAPEEEKTGILRALREAPGDAIKHLTEKLLDLGLENAPKALPLLQTLLHSVHS